MKLVFIALIIRILICLAVSGLFCAIMWLLCLCGLCEMPSWQIFMSVAVFAFLFVVIYDTYLLIRDTRRNKDASKNENK
jgi:hypothetical protein